jgi:uncharacterized lipoprotein YddW (UPF0748 family)
MRSLFVLITAIILSNSLLVQGQSQMQGLAYPDYEMRGAWLTTVVNLDWPSTRNLTVDQQKQELVEILDALKRSGKNAVFFQVRSEADAMFPSPYEPWSYWLSGEQGKAPEPFYDPLRFAITEAHLRGMELHAWLNPYRAHRNLNLYPHHETHIAQTRPEWMLSFPSASGTYVMLNPGLQEVKDFIEDIVTDLVRRYDLDGIHFDDYFYPYSPAVSTEDLASFQADPRGIENINDWRRDNINRMVIQVNDAIKEIDPQVKFGISPFGIRKNSDAGTRGGEGYHLIFADPLQWLQDGSIDYVAPQLYWNRDHEAAPYEPLLNWWASVSSEYNRHLYIGLAPYRLGEPFNWSVNEIGAQKAINRASVNPVHGSIHFRSQHVMDNPQGLMDSLITRWNNQPVLVPSMDWLPKLELQAVDQFCYQRVDDDVTLTWSAHEKATRFAIYRYPEFTPVDKIQFGSNPSNLVALTGGISWDEPNPRPGSWYYAIHPVGRNSELGQPRIILVR